VFGGTGAAVWKGSPAAVRGERGDGAPQAAPQTNHLPLHTCVLLLPLDITQPYSYPLPPPPAPLTQHAEGSEALYSSFKKRPGPQRGAGQPVGPIAYEPYGRRFTISQVGGCGARGGGGGGGGGGRDGEGGSTIWGV
jgi:hypothetical protein